MTDADSTQHFIIVITVFGRVVLRCMWSRQNRGAGDQVDKQVRINVR